MSDVNDPLTGPDGQPLLAMIGDLGATLVSGGLSNSGTSSGGPVLSPITNTGSGLVINITYDSSIAGAPAGFFTAINYVVNLYETIFSTPSTVNIEVGYGQIDGQAMGSGALGESLSFYNSYNYSTIKSALSTSDPNAAASLPATQPGTMWVQTAEAKALGLTLPAGQTSTDLDGYVGFSNAVSFGYDPSMRAFDVTHPLGPTYDFIGVVEHEFSEIMGRTDLLGGTLTDGTNFIFNNYSPLDLFHFTSPGVHTYTGTTTNYFSVNNGVTNLDNFNSNPSGDLGDWASSAGADSYLAFSPSGQANIVSQADITVMNALGYQTAPAVTIEAHGVASLIEYEGNYELGAAGPLLHYLGGLVTVGELGSWSPIAAEATAAGYEVAWKMAGQDLYQVWSTDSNGNFLSYLLPVVTGETNALELLEPSFQQDLNGDGTIGVHPIVIETSGSTELDQYGNNYELNPVGGSTGPMLGYNGSPVYAGEFGDWTPTGAEATASGYEVALKTAIQGLYTVWNTDSNGNYVSSAISGGVGGNTTTLESFESSFHQDLNGDGTIGIPATIIEAYGSTSLVAMGNNFELNPVGGSNGPMLHYNGSLVYAGEFGDWTPIGAEATSGGYEIALKTAVQGLYTVWNTDSNGNYVSSAISGGVAGNTTTLESFESSFHQDLNGDGTIGISAGQSQVASALFASPDLLHLSDAVIVGVSSPPQHHDFS